MGYLFTILTPTHNRAHLLGRLYKSLQRQTLKDFKWMIVDDGSTDETATVVRSFQEEHVLDIEYHFIENGFLYKAMKLAGELVETPYIIRMDDDDELTDNALEVFKTEWERIDSEGVDDIGEIRALAIRDDGTISGHYQPKLNQPPLDTTYLERNMNRNLQLENVSCRRSEIWKQLFHDDDKWLFNKVNYISDSIFWNRLSRLARSRYIFVGLRLYHDTGNSISKVNSKVTRQNAYNKVFSRYVLLNELQDYYFKKPFYFFRELLAFGSYGLALHLQYNKLVYALANKGMRLLFVVFTPVTWLLSKRIILS